MYTLLNIKSLSYTYSNSIADCHSLCWSWLPILYQQILVSGYNNYYKQLEICMYNFFCGECLMIINHAIPAVDLQSGLSGLDS